MDPVQLCLDMAPPAPPSPPAPPPAPPAPPPPAPPAYSVALRESELGRNERNKAEARFCRALEERLGTPDEVAGMLRLLQSAEEEGRSLTPDEEALARRWQRANTAARVTGLQDLAQITGAWFEIRA